MQQGWIKLHRQILDNQMWKEEPFTKGQAWVDLLLLANHKENKILVNGSWMNIKRGQFHTSILKLSDRWKWSRGKTKRFLDVLKTDNMITFECSSGGTSNGTTLTIVKYDDFQLDDTTLDTTNGQRTVQRSVQRTDINKNDKECIKNEKNNIGRFTPPTLEEVQAYCDERENGIDAQAFIDFYESKGWMIGKNKMKDWKSAIRTWERRNPKTTKTMGKQNFDTDSDLYAN